MKWTIRAVLWTAVGDALVLLGVSLAGFATHQSNPAGGRLLAMVVPLLAAWGLTAFLGGLYQPGQITWQGTAWRAVLAGMAAGPLAAVLRGLWLGGAPVVPVFALVLSGTTALGMGLWRILAMWLFKTKARA